MKSRKPLRRLLIRLCLFMVGPLVLYGCSQSTPRPSTVKVSGTVKYEGEPLANGKITFVRKQSVKSQEYARPAVGVIQNGSYSLTTFEDGDGAIPGEYIVTIESVEKELTMEEYNEGKKPKSAIPSKYTNPQSSELSATVPESGPFNRDFDLEP